MLMPFNSSEGRIRMTDLLTVEPTDDLLSPVLMMDINSGFSGSYSGSSYRSADGSLRRGCTTRSSTPVESTGSGSNEGF